MVKLKAPGAHAGLDAGSWCCHGRRKSRAALLCFFQPVRSLQSLGSARSRRWTGVGSEALEERGKRVGRLFKKDKMIRDGMVPTRLLRQIPWVGDLGVRALRQREP
jgi:hypothetical protein